MGPPAKKPWEFLPVGAKNLCIKWGGGGVWKKFARVVLNVCFLLRWIRTLIYSSPHVYTYQIMLFQVRRFRY